MSSLLVELLEQSSARHDHLCPRQVLGVRMGLAALEMLSLERPISKQTALVVIETDGCFADGIEVATGATIGHRTLRVNDLGKVAATFANLQTGRSIRLAPRADARLHARLYAPEASKRYYAQLQGYECMPEHELFRVQEVMLDPPAAILISKPGVRVQCEICGEEIINERERVVEGSVLCRSCAQGAYYVAVPEKASPSRIALPTAELRGISLAPSP